VIGCGPPRVMSKADLRLRHDRVRQLPEHGGEDEDKQMRGLGMCPSWLHGLLQEAGARYGSPVLDHCQPLKAMGPQSRNHHQAAGGCCSRVGARADALPLSGPWPSWRPRRATAQHDRPDAPTLRLVDALDDRPDPDGRAAARRPPGGHRPGQPGMTDGWSRWRPPARAPTGFGCAAGRLRRPRPARFHRL
jgi:hypothetical protein